MNATLVLVYGLLIFLGTVVASIPFGFVFAFMQARGVPVSERARARLKPLEYLLEVVAVVLVTASLYGRQSPEPLLNGLGAFVVASLISFVLEVRLMHMPTKEFFWRTLFAVLACLPLGLFVGSVAYAGA